MRNDHAREGAGAKRARPITAGLSVALLLCLTAAATPAAHAARGMEVAVQDDGQFLSDDAAVRQAAFGHARALGASALRANVLWAKVVSQPTSHRAPVTPTYDLARFDRLVDEAAAYGMRVQLTLSGPAPAWAAGNRKVSVVKPDAGRFGQFAGTMAAHFRGRVRAFSIWNEPNWHGWLEPEKICRRVGRRRRCVKTSALRYRALYQAAYAAIDRADPRVPVWIGETSPFAGRRQRATAPLAYLRQMTCVDRVLRGCSGTLRAQGYAHHPYAFDRAPARGYPGRDNATLGSLERLRAALKRLRTRIRISNGTPIYLTEFAYFSSGRRALASTKRASYTRAAFELALRAPQVRQLLHYQLVDPPKAVPWRSGLISDTGVAHSAYRALVGFTAAHKSRLTLPGDRVGVPTAADARLPRMTPHGPLPPVGVPLL
jgi:hypothetical protein